MDSIETPFTVVLSIQPGEVINGSPAHGFGESNVILTIKDRGPGTALVDLRWGNVVLPTGITAATFLEEFWRGAAVAHADALDFGRALLDRLVGRPQLRDRWEKIRGWRGMRPLRLELILPPAASSQINSVPFELLAEDTFLFFSGATLVRCIRDLDPRRAEIRRNDRLVVAWANPTDMDGRFDDAVFQQHETELSAAGASAQLDVRAPVGRTSLAGLQDALADQRPVPVISLVAHGYPTGGQLALENPDRSSQPVTASDIAAAARGADTQVALLWSCHATRHHSELGSLAEQLLAPSGGNLAAVVATYGALQANWTARAASRLLHALTADGDLEQALTAARQTLSERDPHWAALTYYARPSDGRSVTAEAGQAAIAALSVNIVAGPGGFDALSNATAVRVDGLPRRPHYWIPRPNEVDAVVAQLTADRLVTVCGMPGIGKTEIARDAAQYVIEQARIEAALWIPLDEIGPVEDLRARIAAWCGVLEPDAADARLARAIGPQRALWILDNAESLIRDHGPELRRFLAALVDACPGLRLLLTSQRPLGDLHSEREHRYLVHRLEDADTRRALFAAAASSPLDSGAPADDLAVILELLDGHPRSLVLVASQVRDGGTNLPRLRARLLERTDEAVLAAELLTTGTDWNAHDLLRTERLISSLHLAYQPLREQAPAAAELFCWLGALPAGLPIALAPTIFGDDTLDHIATLLRVSLVELRGADERLELPSPIRWYATRQLASDVSPTRQAELLVRTFDAFSSLMNAAYLRLGKPGADAAINASRREGRNLEMLLDRAQRTPVTAALSGPVARAFAAWSRVRLHGANHEATLALLERAKQVLQPAAQDSVGSAALLEQIGELQVQTHRYQEAEHTLKQAAASFIAFGANASANAVAYPLGRLYFQTNRYSEAEAELQKSIAALSTAEGAAYLESVVLLVGELQLRRYQYKDAETNLNTAVALSTTLGNRVGESNAANALGSLYLLTDRFADAKPALERALDAATAVDHRSGEITSRRALGELHRRTGRREESAHELELALELASKLELRTEIAHAHEGLGRLYREWHPARIDEARASLTAALGIYIEIRDRLGEANTRRALAEIHEHDNNDDDAEHEYQSSIRISSEIDSSLAAAKAGAALGRLYLRTGRLREAFDAFVRAHDNYLKTNRSHDAACQLGYASEVAFAVQHPARAIVLCSQALRGFLADDKRVDAARAYSYLARYADASGVSRAEWPASMLAWHATTSCEDAALADLRTFFSALASTRLDPQAFAAGLSPDEIAALDRQLGEAVAEVSKRLEAAGEDPFGALPVVPEPP